MTARVTIKPRADRDLDEYGDRLAREASLDVALRFFDTAQRTFTLLAAQPNMGWRSRINYPGLEALRVFRLIGFKRMLVFYRPLPQGV